MARNWTRSQNRELLEGSTDGKYKKIAKADRGGVVEPATYQDRMDLDDTWFGFHEAPIKVTPDGKIVHDAPPQSNSLPMFK